MSTTFAAIPSVRWEDRAIGFSTSLAAPDEYRVEAVVVFAFHAGTFVLADIEGRGWTTPSGRIEAGETPEQAAVRETREEIGADALDLRRIGGFAMTLDDGRRIWAPAYVCTVRGFGAIPAGSESRGAMAVAPMDIRARYFRWDTMLAAAFDHAARCVDGG
jgi:8-oxo-dGTP pyrophosphatase MutT (NUDIX family)